MTWLRTHKGLVAEPRRPLVSWLSAHIPSGGGVFTSMPFVGCYSVSDRLRILGKAPSKEPPVTLHSWLNEDKHLSQAGDHTKQWLLKLISEQLPWASRHLRGMETMEWGLTIPGKFWPLPWLGPSQTGARMDSPWEYLLAINTMHFNPTPSNVGLFVSQSHTSGMATSLSKECSRARIPSCCMMSLLSQSHFFTSKQVPGHFHHSAHHQS